MQRLTEKKNNIYKKEKLKGNSFLENTIEVHQFYIPKCHEI